jgi:5,6-dimethylbenzimidazole synthase
MATKEYDSFLNLLNLRRSIRKFKPDPIPDEATTEILEAARLSMSGANSQPWEFIVVKNHQTIEKVAEAYIRNDLEMAWALEQQRTPEHRHPAFNILPEEKEKLIGMGGGAWKEAPVCIMVLEDPRKQFGSVLSAHGDFPGSVLSQTMGHLSMIIHLAAAALGLGSQRVDVACQEAYREILGYPEPLRLNIIVPVGYRAYDPGPPHRLPLDDLVHHETYDIQKYMKHDDFLKYIEKIRKLGRPGYRVAIGEDKG